MVNLASRPDAGQAGKSYFASSIGNLLGRFVLIFRSFSSCFQGISMSLSSDDVEKIAHLARLAVNSDETGSLSRDLSNILDLVAQMEAVDTGGVLPMAHPLEMSQRLRLDEVTETNQRELYQSNAPQAEAGLFLVPKVIE